MNFERASFGIVIAACFCSLLVLYYLHGLWVYGGMLLALPRWSVWVVDIVDVDVDASGGGWLANGGSWSHISDKSK